MGKSTSVYNAYQQHKWVVKTPIGYFYGSPDHIGYFDSDLKECSRYDSPREAKNAVLASAVLEAINGRTVPAVSYERIVETVDVDGAENGEWDVNQRVAHLMMIRKISRSVAESYQWLMTSRDIDYTEWKCAAYLPEWEFSDPDDETVAERLEKVNVPAVISKQTVFVKREEDFAVLRFLFDDMLLCVSLEDGTVLLDNRS